MLSFFITLQNLVTERVEAGKDRGATAVEYGLLVALIAATIIVVVGLLGGNLNRIFGIVNTRLDAVV